MSKLRNFEPYVSFKKDFKPYVPSIAYDTIPDCPNDSRLIGLTPDIAVFDGLMSELGKKLDVYDVILLKSNSYRLCALDNDLQW